jgi:hypothetical protein
MSTLFSNVFSINGVIDTNQSVLANMNAIATASGAWVTYDVNQGKWAVIINTTGSSVASFNDNNIIGGINISSTGLNELYNSVEIEFPHKDLIDQRDYIRFDIDSTELYPNETANNLAISIDLINDPIQAELIAARELKQSRVDKVVNFKTDYTKIDLKAGDLIDVTSSQYEFSAKVFRVIKISEEDQDDGGLIIDITALEYSADVYSTASLARSVRTPITIKPRTNNTALDTKDDIDQGEAILRLLGTSLATNLLNSFFTKNLTTGKVTQTISPKDATVESNLITAATGDKGVALRSLKRPSVIFAGPSSICEGSTLTLNLTLDCSECLFDAMSYNYTISGVTLADTTSFPLTGTVTVPGTMNIPIATDPDTGTETLTITIGSSSKSVTIYNQLAYTYITTASPTSITEGASSTVTLTTTGVANGTTVPYVISGTGTGQVSTALTGSVTVNSNIASLVIATTDDAIYTGTQSILVSFTPPDSDNCNQLDTTAAISLLDNESESVCQTIVIPVVWCPTYNTLGRVKSLSVVKTATVQAPVSGGATVTVPLTVSVTPGSPSTVTVLTTATIDASSNKAGQDFKVITTFNSIPVNGVVTGTTTTVTGY